MEARQPNELASFRLKAQALRRGSLRKEAPFVPGRHEVCTVARPERDQVPNTRMLTPMGRLREFWIGRADLAPVSLFRIVYGVELFNWFWQLYPNLAAFFTDQGFMPRSLLVEPRLDLRARPRVGR